MAQLFPFRVGERSRTLLRLFFGVRPGHCQVTIWDDRILVDFGYASLVIPIDAVVRWRIEGPWRWITAIGIRRSLRNGGMSFAGSPRGGVRLDLDPPVRWRFLRLQAVYLGVADLEGFAAALDRRGIAGHDARGATRTG